MKALILLSLGSDCGPGPTSTAARKHSPTAPPYKHQEARPFHNRITLQQVDQPSSGQ